MLSNNRNPLPLSMGMFKRIIIAILFLSLHSTCFGLMEETLDQCIQKYGNVVKIDGDTYCFLKNYINVRIKFDSKGKAEHVKYYRDGNYVGFNKDEIAKLLEINTGKGSAKKWILMANDDLMAWIYLDLTDNSINNRKEYTAQTYNNERNSGYFRELIIETKEYSEKIAKYRNGKESVKNSQKSE